MSESNLNVIKSDAYTLVKDAQALFSAAANASGEKADEMRARGMRILESALADAQHAHASAMASGREMAASADVYVRDNPWRMIAAAGGIGLLAGFILGRK